MATQSKVASLPDNCLIYNGDIHTDSAKRLLEEKLDLDYYIKRTYEKLLTFIPPAYLQNDQIAV